MVLFGDLRGDLSLLMAPRLFRLIRFTFVLNSSADCGYMTYVVNGQCRSPKLVHCFSEVCKCVRKLILIFRTFGPIVRKLIPNVRSSEKCPKSNSEIILFECSEECSCPTVCRITQTLLVFGFLVRLFFRTFKQASEIYF